MAISARHDPVCGNSRNVLRIISAAGDEERLAAMVARPVLVNGPIVFPGGGARPCPPSEAALDPAPAGPAIDGEDRRIV